MPPIAEHKTLQGVQANQPSRPPADPPSTPADQQTDRQELRSRTHRSNRPAPRDSLRAGDTSRRRSWGNCSKAISRSRPAEPPQSIDTAGTQPPAQGGAYRPPAGRKQPSR